MTKINLREQYPDFYKTDYIIEVPDEVAAVMKEHDRLEAAYRRRTYYHKAHYSLDRGDGIEYDALFVSMKPSVVMLEQIRTIDKSRLKNYIGHLNKDDMENINKTLLCSLGIT